MSEEMKLFLNELKKKDKSTRIKMWTIFGSVITILGILVAASLPVSIDNAKAVENLDGRVTVCEGGIDKINDNIKIICDEALPRKQFEVILKGAMIMRDRVQAFNDKDKKELENLNKEWENFMLVVSQTHGTINID